MDAVLASAGVEDIAGHMVDGSVDSLPRLESAKVITNTIVLTFDENLDQDSMPAASAFTVKINGQPLTVAGMRFALDTASVTVLGTVQYGDVVTVSYTPPATNPLQDADGNRVLAFTDVMVRNNAAPPASVPPAPAAAEVAGNTVALDFDEDLDGDSTPDKSAFTVKGQRPDAHHPLGWSHKEPGRRSDGGFQRHGCSAWRRGDGGLRAARGQPAPG